MNRSILAISTLAFFGAMRGPSAQAQWSADAMNNLRVADRPGDQVQPKIAATPDGGAYLSWFDNSTGGYDVTIQRINAQGVEQWAHNGVPIADRTQSSTQDYDLVVGSDGTAIIGFDDYTDPSFPTTRQINVQKVSAAGVKLWGSGGANVALTTGSGGNNPHIGALPDGGCVVGWTTNASPSTWAMIRLDSNGNFAAGWTTPIITSEASRPLTLTDIQPDGSGGFIALWIRAGSAGFSANRYLYTQKFDGSGAAQWNAGSPVVVFSHNGGTAGLQIGYFPRFVPDGAGGAVYGWYETTNATRNASIQHVLSTGTLKFPQPIDNTGVTPGRIRVGAGLAYDRAGGSYYLASPETDASTQSQNSVIVQKYDAAGNRLWSDTGFTIVPISNASQPSFVQAQAIGGDVLVCFMETRSALTRVISAARVNHNGASPVLAWYFQPNSDSGTDKSRLTSAPSACSGFAMLAYGWGSGGSADIGVQNVLPDGSIGPGTCPSFITQPPAGAHPCQGSTLTLTGAPGGNSAPCLQWRKNGVALTNGGRVAGAASGTLTITNVQASDAGSYDVVASNTCGNQPSSATAVTICAVDFNCDNALSVADIFDFLGAWFAGAPNADFNRNGVLSVNDIFDFLGAWFAGC